ncbi:MAG: isoprenylcysteine carboxylmethyltransferase family protein [Acidobacteriota bacterium]|jgi:protein-S-isoprenylcysteine O-methyltransferase Ste14
MLTDWNRRWRRWAAYNRVRATIILGLAYVAFSRPYWNGLAVGTTLIAVGQALRFWGAGYLEKNQRLARGGPYRWVRHPLYAGSLMMGLGLSISVTHPLWWTLLYLVLFVGFFVPAIHVEELRLQSIFGAEYQDFMVDVPALVPRLKRRSSPPMEPTSSSFSWRRVLGNREARSVIAMAALLAIQAAKILLGQGA